MSTIDKRYGKIRGKLTKGIVSDYRRRAGYVIVPKKFMHDMLDAWEEVQKRESWDHGYRTAFSLSWIQIGLAGTGVLI